MIEILVPFSDRLNLNGDLANGLILTKRLAWAGIDSRIIPLSSIDEIIRASAKCSLLSDNSFLLLGHGSKAAMESISEAKGELVDLISAVKSSGGAGLVVGSSYEWLVPHASKERLSEFVESDLNLPDSKGKISAVGYVNSASALGNMLWDGKILFTRFHGPILAKSPDLADFFCEVLTNGKYVAKVDSKLVDAINEAKAVALGKRD